MDTNRTGISCRSDAPMSAGTPEFLHSAPEKSGTVIPSMACMPILANSLALPTTQSTTASTNAPPEPAAH
eukprot:6452697-Lingulodinium_polyedra.AAC.1